MAARDAVTITIVEELSLSPFFPPTPGAEEVMVESVNRDNENSSQNSVELNRNGDSQTDRPANRKAWSSPTNLLIKITMKQQYI